jgi:tetratricopeptide (TPR) repeat protein
VTNLNRALSTHPDYLEASVMMARARLLARDARGAEEALIRAVDADRENLEAKLVLGHFYELHGRHAEAAEQYRLALRQDPRSGAALFQLARTQLAQGDKTAAEQNLKRLASFSGSQKQAYALFLLQEGRLDEGIREMQRLVRQNPDDRRLRTQLIAAYRLAGRQADALNTLDAALKGNSRDLDALAQRGEFYLQAGRYAEAEADFHRVLELKPNSAEVHYLLAKFNQARGAVHIYRQEMAEALRLNPEMLAVRIEYAGDLMANASGKAALELLESAPEHQKNLLDFITQRNWALWSTGSLAEMRKGIDYGLERQRTPELLLQDALWKLRSDKPAESRAAVEEVLKLNPGDLRALATLKLSYDARKQSSLAIQKVKEYAALQPGSAPVQAFLGRLLLTQGDRSGARAAFNAAKAADPRHFAADLSLVQLDALDRNWNGAVERLRTVLATDPNHVDARLWLGNIEINRGNGKAALEHFRKVIEIRPDEPQALNNLAYLLIQHGGNPDQALRYAQRAQELDPDNADYADTLGWILYEKGLYAPAVQYLERAAKSGSALVQYHLAMAYARAGNKRQGQSVLEAALKSNPHLPEARLARQVLNDGN